MCGRNVFNVWYLIIIQIIVLTFKYKYLSIRYTFSLSVKCCVLTLLTIFKFILVLNIIFLKSWTTLRFLLSQFNSKNIIHTSLPLNTMKFIHNMNNNPSPLSSKKIPKIHMKIVKQKCIVKYFESTKEYHIIYISPSQTSEVDAQRNVTCLYTIYDWWWPHNDIVPCNNTKHINHKKPTDWTMKLTPYC